MARVFALNEDLLVETESRSFGFNSRIIGVKPHHYLVLDLPLDLPGTSQLKVDDKVRVNCFHAPIIHFQSKILQILDNPPLLVLEFPPPEAIQKADRRSSQRVKLLFQASCIDLQEEPRDPFEVYLLDISDAGCLISVDVAPPVGHNLLLSFQIPWSREDIQTKARVIHSYDTERGTRCGVEFVDMDPENQKRLDAFIDLLDLLSDV